MTDSPHNQLWQRIRAALAAHDALPSGYSTETEVADHANSRLRTDVVQRFVRQYYAPRKYGDGEGALSDAEAQRLVQEVEALPLTVPPAAPAQRQAAPPGRAAVTAAAGAAPSAPAEANTNPPEAVAYGVEEEAAERRKRVQAARRKAEEERRGEEDRRQREEKERRIVEAARLAEEKQREAEERARATAERPQREDEERRIAEEARLAEQERKRRELEERLRAEAERRQREEEERRTAEAARLAEEKQRRALQEVLRAEAERWRREDEERRAREAAAEADRKAAAEREAARAREEAARRKAAEDERIRQQQAERVAAQREQQRKQEEQRRIETARLAEERPRRERAASAPAGAPMARPRQAQGPDRVAPGVLKGGPAPPARKPRRSILSRLSVVLAAVGLFVCVLSLTGLLPGAQRLWTIVNNPRPQSISLADFLAHGSRQEWVTITNAYVNVRQDRARPWPTGSDGRPLLPLVTYDSGNPSQKSDLFVEGYQNVVKVPVCDRDGRPISLDGYFDPDYQPKWDRRTSEWTNYNHRWGCYPVPNYHAEARTLSGMLSTVDEKSKLSQEFHDRGILHPTVLELDNTPPSLNDALFQLGAGAFSLALGGSLLFFLYRRGLILA